MLIVMDQGHVGALMLLDLSAAFDTVVTEGRLETTFWGERKFPGLAC